MQYIIIICILFFIITKLYDVLRTGWEFLYKFLKKHTSYAVIFGVVGICLLFGWHGIAGFIVIVSILYLPILKRRQENNLRELKAWLNKNATRLGETSAEAMLGEGDNALVPNHFFGYAYPSDNSVLTIVQDFLNDRQHKLEARFCDTAYEVIQTKGMIEQEDLQDILFPRYVNATRTIPLSELFSKSVSLLEAMHKIDRPIQGHDTLHCIGATEGSQFESVELGELDI